MFDYTDCSFFYHFILSDSRRFLNLGVLICYVTLNYSSIDHITVPDHYECLKHSWCQQAVLLCPQVGECEHDLRETQQKLLSSEEEQQKLREQVSPCTYLAISINLLV